MYAKAFALLTIVSLVQGGVVAPAGVAYANYAFEGPHIGAQSEQTVRGFGGTVSKQQKAIVGPHSHVTKHDTRITNDGVGIAYSQAIAPAYHHAAYPVPVAHAAPVAAVAAPLGHHYAHHAPAPVYAPHAYSHPAPIYAHHPYAHHPAPVAVAAPVVKTALPVAAAPVHAAYATHVKSAAPVYAHHPAPAVSYAAHPYQHYAHTPLVAAAPIAKVHAPVSYAAPVAAVAKVHASPLGYSLITPNVFSLNFEGHGIKYHY